MKVTFKQKDTFWGKKTEIDFLDYEWQIEDLEKMLERFKVLSK